MSPSNQKADKFVFAVLVPVIAISVIIASLTFGYRQGQANGAEQANASFQRDAINHNFAQYDIKTGVWRWREPSELIFMNIVEEGGQKLISNLPMEDAPKPKKK